MRRIAVLLATLSLFIVALAPAASSAPKKESAARGSGGAVSSVDALATNAGLRVLRNGGNAVDAAVTTAAVLGVTEPYSAGIGGGGFMVIYLAETGEVITLDGREDAPDDPRFDEDVFLEDGVPIPFFPERITSGLGVGVPGTFATWVEALDLYGTISIGDALKPGIRVAERGFPVDQTFADQTAGNQSRFLAFPATAELFLDNGEVPEVGSVFRNPELAETYRSLRQGFDAFYTGDLAEEIAETVQYPPTVADPPFTVRPGYMTVNDLETYEVLHPDATAIEYRGYEVFGMGPPSSGGTTVGEALNILESDAHGAGDISTLDPSERQHMVLESTAFSFADRNAYLGDDRYVYVPVTGLLSQGFGDERAALVDPAAASVKPVAAGDPCEEDGNAACTPVVPTAEAAEGQSTTHLVTADQYGNVVSYTLTIESTGGSGITVPGRGFLLNNELTDFNSTGPSPNLPAPGKRPRSSMSPTIVLDGGQPWLAVGSPGGSTIITTVAAVLVNRIDGGMSLAEAIAAPRATQRNTTSVRAEQAYLDEFGAYLEGLGHTFSTSTEIGATTGVEILPGGLFIAAAEPERRGGGAAGVVRR